MAVIEFKTIFQDSALSTPITIFKSLSRYPWIMIYLFADLTRPSWDVQIPNVVALTPGP